MEAPRTARYVARTQLALVALAVIAGLVGGIAMQLELWRPGPTWSIGHYSRMLGVHGVLSLAIGAPVLAGCFGYVAIAELVGARRVIAPAIAWVGLGLWVIGLGASFVGLVWQSDADTGWTLYTPYSTVESSSHTAVRVLGPLALAAAGLVYAIHLGAMIVAAIRTAAPAKLALATAFVVGIGAACAGSLVDAFATAGSGQLVLLATAFAAVVLAVAALVRDPRQWAVGAFGALGIVPALALYGFTHLISTSSFHLHDTYFEVGRHHAIAACVTFAGLAALHAWSATLVRRTPQPTLALLGAIACCAGMGLHIYASLRLGGAGMPRRYWDYDPQFTAGHMLAGTGAAIFLGGLALLAIAWLAGRYSSSLRSPSSTSGPLSPRFEVGAP